MRTLTSYADLLAIPFTNEPLLRFDDAESTAMGQALARVSAALGREYPLIIGGGRVRTATRVTSVNPACPSQIVGVHAEADATTADRAVNAAFDAFGTWRFAPVDERAGLLLRVAAEVRARRLELSAWLIFEVGKNWREADAEVAEAIDFLEFYAREAIRLADSAPPIQFPGERDQLAYIPVGVCAVLPPWNFPLAILAGLTTAAIACGNTVVVKPSEETPSTATLLGEVMNKVGVPKGVYNVVHGFGPGSAGELLTRHKGVNAITFTGETRTGAAIMKAAADGTRPVSFELGGKNAGVVFADCDFDAAVDGITRAVFANCGQVCLGTERVYVERPIFDRFVQALKARAEGMQPGRPEDAATGIGPLISEEHRNKVLSYYRKAVADGATVVTGGGIPDMPKELATGAWIQPTIWTGLPETSAVIREEIFGPCCHVRPFDGEDEAVKLANDTPYGLATTIWTTNLARAHRVAAKIDVGITWVNSWFLRDLRTPFGGSKESGIGREGGVHSLEFYTELRNICVKL
jgi:aminomuconate-semialdehyde/2-hydroxymuconate-6-semialdehyde dehydrogenase